MGLDLSTFNVRRGYEGHKLHTHGLKWLFSPAGPEAAADPLDLRLRFAKVRESVSA